MKPVRYDEDADEELIDEIARYELRREDLGIEFSDRRPGGRSSHHPEPERVATSEHAPDLRRFVMKRFPFTNV
jgi:hypothetical protein